MRRRGKTDSVRRGIIAALATAVVLIGGCSHLQNLDPTVRASCSVAGNDPFDLPYTRGPELTADQFLDTQQGEALDAFFNGGPGEVEGAEYLEADGFSIVSEGYVLGYRDGRPSSDFSLDGADVRGWGGCRSVLVGGNQTASRWDLDSPPDPNATTIPILVEGGACVEPDGDRIITEIVVQDEDAVVITVWTRNIDMPAMCAGVGIDLEAEAALDLPLGDRALLDGGLLPPAPIEIPR